MYSKVLTSKIDRSANIPTNYKGLTIETRFVQRRPENFIVYVSTHTGCVMRCKFCWLTQTGQTSFRHLDVEAMTQQFVMGRNYWRAHNWLPITRRVNINFMARGEPLANANVINRSMDIWNAFRDNAQELQLKWNISTIMPRSLNRSLVNVFRGVPANLYYSFYSMNPDFRKKWLPNAMPIHDALTLLREYEEHAPHDLITPVTFHCTFIAGENDAPADVAATADLIKSFGFRRAKLNVVRYNPAPNTHYQESPHIEEIFRQYSAAIPNKRNYIVPRVGPDVYASCGMFISP